MSDFISAKEIAGAAPEGCKNLYRVAVSGMMPRSAAPVVRAFWSAASRYGDHAYVNRPLLIVFGDRRPYRVDVAGQSLTFDPASAAATSIECFIFVHWPTLLPIDERLRVATFLEELVHGLAGIADEEITRTVVTMMYPEVVRSGHFYSPAGPH